MNAMRGLQEGIIVTILLYGSETMAWYEFAKSGVRMNFLKCDVT